MAVSSALEVISAYVKALAGRDSDGMNGLRADDFVLDFVHGDAFENRPIWFDAFPEFDLEVTRTVAADEVVVTQWIFTGTNTGPLDPPIFEKRVESTGKTVRLRGVSVYDVIDGRVLRETLYFDLVTLMVDLGMDL